MSCRRMNNGRNSWQCGLDCERNSTLSFLESWKASNGMSVCWAMKGISFRPAMPSVTSASSSTRVVSPSNGCGKNSIHLSTRASTSMRTVTLLRGSVRIAECLYRAMLRQGRMGKRFGMMKRENGFINHAYCHPERSEGSDYIHLRFSDSSSLCSSE